MSVVRSSAFSDRAWGALFAGWELREYQDRQREKEERSRARTKIELEWPAGVGQRQDQVRAALLERLQTSWPRQIRSKGFDRGEGGGYPLRPKLRRIGSCDGPMKRGRGSLSGRSV